MQTWPRPTLLVKSKTGEKWSHKRGLTARETEDIPLLKLTPIAVDIDHCDLTNRVTTSFTLVGNSTDSWELAECHDAVYDTPSNDCVHLPGQRKKRDASNNRHAGPVKCNAFFGGGPPAKPSSDAHSEA